MNVSIELRSTMSPKRTKPSRTPYKPKSPAILSLKKNIRRSSIYARKSLKEEIIIIDSASSSSSSSDSTSSSEDIKPVILNPLKTDSDTKFDENLEDTVESIVESCNLRESDLRRLNELNEINTKRKSRDKKHSEIARWVTDVHNSSSVTLFSEVSTISGGSNPGFQKPGDRIAVNSTADDLLAPRFDQLFIKQRKEHSIDSYTNSTETPDIQGPIVIEDSFITDDESLGITKKSEKQIIKNSLSHVVVKKSLELIKETEENVDSIEFVENKVIEDSFLIEDSNENPLDIVKKREYSAHSSDFKVTKRASQEKTTDVKKIHEDEDSWGSSFKLVIEESEKNTTPTEKDVIVCDDSNADVEDMLDSLYGDSWRAKKDLIFSEPQSKTKRIGYTEHTNTMTERKIKKTPTYKNPYSDNELAKSDKLLRNLQQTRLIKALESPLLQNLRNLCDSESDNDNFSQLRAKLNFENSSDEDDEVKIKTSSASSNSSLVKVPKTTNRKAKKTTNKKNMKDKENTPKFNDNDDSDDESWIPNESKIKRKTIGICSFLESLSKSIPLSQCDPAARIFRNNFKKFRNELSTRLFKLYNEQVFEGAIPEDTELVWNDRLRGTAGRCRCRKIIRRTGEVQRTAVIELSTKVLDSADRLRDTFIHELCHAATWIVNQVADGHGAFWKSWAYKAMKTFPELPPIKRCHSYVLNAKYTYKCTKCGYSIARHTKSLNTERKRCGHCYGQFECLLNKVSKKGETKSVPIQKKPPTGFALFVKENYATYKSSDLKHGDVMKILGDKFAKMKVNK